jgi:hypothetical protein
LNLILHTLLLQKLSVIGLSDGYVNWSRSYSTIKQFLGQISWILSLTIAALSGVPYRSVLVPPLFSIIWLMQCNEVAILDTSLLMTFIIFCVIRSPHTFVLLQSDIHSMRGSYNVYIINLKISRSKKAINLLMAFSFTEIL